MDVAGLIIGGLIAAPIAARLVGKIPMKAMYIAVGLLVILTSMLTLIKGILTSTFKKVKKETIRHDRYINPL